MKVLVTGATGFVGACLARRLVADGHEVHVFTRRESNRWRIADILPQLADHPVDLRDSEGVAGAVGRVRPEVVFHLATYGGFASQRETRTILDANLTGTANLLRACERTGFSRFINTGSSSEYGLQATPMREDTLPEPVGDYAVSKVAATLFCRSEAVAKGLPVITLRLFSPYGPWDDPQRFIPYLLARLLRGEPPQLANPAAVRDYVFIDDVVDAYLLAVKETLPPGEVYNVGSGRQHTIAEVAGIIRGLVAGDAEPVWGARDVHKPEPRIWVADISKIRKALGWESRVHLPEGLARTTAWFREHLRHY